MSATCEVLAVGDELLRGEIVNGNAAWLGKHLAGLGWRVTRSTAVGDDVNDIRDALLDALRRVPLVLMCGGLGPTQDDLTREGLAAAGGVELVRDPFLEAVLQQRFAELGRAVSDRNLRQAGLPVSGHALVNPVGSAPGLSLRVGAGLVLAFPGVPAELYAMAQECLPAELAVLGIETAPRASVAVRTVGVWESDVADLLGDLELRARSAGSPEIAFLASGGQTRVVLTAESLAELEPWVQQVRELLGEAVIEVGEPGVDPVALPRSVVELLQSSGHSVACAESLTAGLLCASLGDVPGASSVLRGGVSAYASDVKSLVLGVDTVALHGAVSAETAQAMATCVREKLQADWGVATTGVAGPDPSEGRPPGTVHIAVAGPDGVVSRQLSLPGPRERVRRLTVVQALDLLRRELLNRSSG